MSAALMNSSQLSMQGGGGLANSILNNVEPIQNLVYGAILILIISFSYEVPTSVRISIDSIWGRIISLGIVYFTIRYFGWIYGLLAAIAFILVIRAAPRINSVEGFFGMQGKNVERPTARWFVERVLGEKPIRLEFDNVGTEAVQDDSDNNGISR
jgi:hypothetical protein